MSSWEQLSPPVPRLRPAANLAVFDQGFVDRVAEENLQPGKVLVQGRRHLGVPVVEGDGSVHIPVGYRQIGGETATSQTAGDDPVIEC